jgi:anaerobic magnesium-protoporphyrin IX monomethyl ester cyclase
MDCLIIGYNDANFEDYVKMIKSMGTDSGAFRDLNLAYIDYDNKPCRSMDILNYITAESKNGDHRPYHNTDFLWPVVSYLGSYLSKRGFSFDYVNLFHLEKDKLKDKLLHEDILTIAITTTLYVSPHPMLEIISFIKQFNERAKIIIGGPYISNQAKMLDRQEMETLFGYLGADFYVISAEGELALTSLIYALKNNLSLDNIDNIAYKKSGNGGFVSTATSTESNSLEENMINYNLFPSEEIGEFLSLRTAKSCPFACSFCGFPQRAGKYTYLSVGLVEQELNALREIGPVTTLTFLDDTFNVPKGRFKELLRMMIKNKYGFKWNSFYRSDHGDEETIELMAEAGCEGVFLGVESGSDSMMEIMNKTARRKDYLKAIPLLKQVGISTHSNVIVGFPGETYETYLDTISLIEEVKPDFFRAQLWYADPTTPIWNEREKYGVKGSGFNWSHDTMDAKTACDLIDRMFLSVENSIWLPQQGFEQWSTFYLQRKGMTMDRIKAFVKCFNDAVKEKVIHPEKTDVSPGLIDRMRAACGFDDTQGGKPDQVEIYPSYNAAEDFWLAEFESYAPTPGVAILRDRIESTGGELAGVSCDVNDLILRAAQENCSAELRAVILAAFGVLCSRLSGRQDVAMVTALGRESMAMPLKLSLPWNQGFREFVRGLEQKVQEARQHALYAFNILTNPVRMAERGLECPVFDVGFAYSESSEVGETRTIMDALSYHGLVREGLGLALKASRDINGIKLSLDYSTAWFAQETVEKLSSYLQAILGEVSENPDIWLGKIALDSKASERHLVAQADESEVFNF